MNVLTIDCENSYGILNPWEKGFYLTCVGMLRNDEPQEVIWFQHCKKLPTKFAVQKIQKQVDWADRIVAHNLKHDLNILRYIGVDFENVQLHCTQVTEYLLSGQDSERQFNLEAVLTHRGIGRKLDIVRTFWDDGYATQDIPAELLEEYVLDDCIKEKRVYDQQVKEVIENGMEALVSMQNEFTLILSDMELAGNVFDSELAWEIYQDHLARKEKYEKELVKLAGIDEEINFGSNQHKSALLYGGIAKIQRSEWVTKTLKTKPETRFYERKWKEDVPIEGLGFKPKKEWAQKIEGYYKTGDEIVSQLKPRNKLQRKALDLLSKIAEMSKVCTTLYNEKDYTKGLINMVQPDGRLHTQFNQTVTNTGRLSSSNPNEQNLWPVIKQCIKPRYDVIMQLDLSQIEWRAAAVFSKDPVMTREINRNIDQHAAACTDPNLMNVKFIDKNDPESKKNRKHAKFFNFRMIYGGTPFGFFMDHKMPNFSKRRWERIVDGFYKKYSRLPEWQNRNIQRVWENAGVLQIATGRKFQFHKTDYKNGEWSYPERKIKNYPVQGIAGGDILPLMCVIIRRGLKKWGLKSEWILTVHDSIVFDVIKDEIDRLNKLCETVVINLPRYMYDYFGMEIPVKIDSETEIGPDYGNLEFYSETTHIKR